MSEYESVPSAGGGTLGIGGQAPSFAPGGPDNPYPASAGMPPAFPTTPEGEPLTQEEIYENNRAAALYAQGQQFLRSQQIMSSTNFPYPPNPQSSLGDSGAGSISSTGGRKRMPQPPQQRPSTLPAGLQLGQGFMAQIIPVRGGGGLPGAPTQPLPPEPPTVGGGPIMPPLRPGERPPNPDQPPTVGGGPIVPPGMPAPPESGQKPHGWKTLPMPKDEQPPEGPPKPPGNWVTVDGGKGQPPAYGFVESVDSGGGDTGLEPSPKKHGTGGHTPGTLPSGPGKGPSGGGSGEAGHYVPLDVYGREPKDGESTVWCWIPTIDASYGVKEPVAPDKPQPK